MSATVGHIQKKTEVSTERVVVGPTLAKLWLSTSKINRKISESSVLEYAVAMERGEWLPDGPPITFLGDGSLSNGHHRLHSVILSGMDIEFTVQRGVSRETREVEDSGRSRTLADKITMFRPNVENVTSRLAQLRMCVQLLSPDVRLRSLSDWDHWTKIFGEAIDWAQMQFSASPSRYRRGSVSGALVFAYQTNPKKVCEFGKAFAMGVHLRVGDPVHTLRKFLDDGGTADKDSKNRIIIARKVLACVSAYLGGQRLLRVYATPETVRDFTDAYNNPKVNNLVTPWQRRERIDE